uniref:Uncharacterized protein n=1 Tax=Arundo donax TaxID=35708 RepID=A0A0A9AIM7_ARUDO
MPRARDTAATGARVHSPSACGLRSPTVQQISVGD